MPRPSVQINKSDLENVIQKLESEQTFSNLSSLCQKVCDTDWAKSLKNSAGNSVTLQPQTVYNRIQEFKIPVITKPGRRGGGLAGVKRDRKPRSELMASNSLVQKAFDELRASTPKQHTKLVDRISAGSLKAAMKLKCLDCVNYQPGEIATSSCFGCPLMPFVCLHLTKLKKGTGETD